jgi:hypothetical protein
MRVPEGLHPAKVFSVKREISKSGDYLLATLNFTILKPNLKAKRISATFCIRGITPNAKDYPVDKGCEALQAVFRAARRKVGPPDSIVGAQMLVLVGTRGHNGRRIAHIEDYYPLPDSEGMLPA